MRGLGSFTGKPFARKINTVSQRSFNMLFEFLQENKKKILVLATKDSLVMSGARPSSSQLEAGLPIFFDRLLNLLKAEELHHAELAKSTGQLGLEILQLGFTLSHVVHVYGSLRQSITGLASNDEYRLRPSDLRDLNHCLDLAIASAVTEYKSISDLQKNEKEIRRCGFCAHELRNALGAATMSFQMIKSGSVGITGSIGQILEKNLLLMENLIGRSLTEVKLGQSEVKIQPERISLLLLVDQILLTATIEANARDQHFVLQIAPTLFVEADRQFLNSALSNLIQNAIKYSHKGTKIEIRGSVVGENILIEIEDECGGLAPNAEVNLFKPFEQQNKNRQGLGLGLNIARKAIELHSGTLEVRNLPNKGCVFSITLPKNRV
jgi:signal transduction histidine kinase